MLDLILPPTLIADLSAQATQIIVVFSPIAFFIAGILLTMGVASILIKSLFGRSEVEIIDLDDDLI